MKKITLYLTILLVVGLFTSCKDYVTNIDPLVTQVKDSDLDTPANIGFVISGVEYQFATASAQLYVDADLMSDQFFFSQQVPGATYPTFLEIDQTATETTTNNTIRNTYTAMGQAWFYATNLLDRLGRVSGLDAATTNEAKFVGTFYSSYVLYQYATYWALGQTQPGSPVNGGPFETSAQLYTKALAGFKASLAFAADDAQKRMVNTTIARTYLYMGDYANATTYALQGMVDGDPSFDLLYSVQNPSEYYSNAGHGRSQCAADFRYNDYITADANEANRIALYTTTGNDNNTYYIQAKMYNQADPVPVTTWQENNLILAECALRGQTSAGVPLTLVNAVRASHNIAPAASVVLINTANPYDPNVCSIYSERDKELFCTGTRLVDNRRFGLFQSATGLVNPYFPIPVDELDGNKNL
jgi:tetratricopeptide (TPR) repeat protein